MSLIKCHECGKEFSTDAKACPSCGAKRKKSVGIIGIVLALLFGVMLFKCTTSVEDSGRRAAEREAAKTPEQKAAEAAARQKQDQRVTMALRVQKLVREHAKNPASLKFEQLGISENADLACGTYRATNSFNAVVTGVVVVAPDGYGFDAKDWKKYCAKATGLHDMSGTL